MKNHDVIKWKHFRITGLLCGEFTGHRWISAQRPVTQSFDVFFDLYIDRHLSKQWRRWWFKMPSRSLWRHWNSEVICKWHESTNNCKYNQNFNYDSKLIWLKWLTCIKFILVYFIKETIYSVHLSCLSSAAGRKLSLPLPWQYTSMAVYSK